MSTRLEQVIEYYTVRKSEVHLKYEKARLEGDHLLLALYDKEISEYDTVLKNFEWLKEEVTDQTFPLSSLVSFVKCSFSRDVDIRKEILDFLDSDEGKYLTVLVSIMDEMKQGLFSSDPRTQLHKISELLRVLSYASEK